MGVAPEALPPDHPSFGAMLELARETSRHPGLREAGPHLLVVASR